MGAHQTKAQRSPAADRGPKKSCRPRAKQDNLAKWSKALDSSASPQGRRFEVHSCHSLPEERHMFFAGLEPCLTAAAAGAEAAAAAAAAAAATTRAGHLGWPPMTKEGLCDLRSHRTSHADKRHAETRDRTGDLQIFSALSTELSQLRDCRERFVVRWVWSCGVR